MKNFFLLSSIIILIFASCKQNKKETFYEYNFVPVDSFSLPLRDSVHNLAYDLQLLKQIRQTIFLFIIGIVLLRFIILTKRR